jgi:ribosomal protein S18 acetylase RimI-like enzyme
MFARFDGEVSFHTDYVAARTATNPGFWWGNFILFHQAPREGDVDAWEQIFIKEVGWLPGIRHRNFAWDDIEGAKGESGAFIERGYKLSESVFLQATSVSRAPRSNDDVVVRPLSGDDEWHAALANQHAALSEERDTPSFREFQTAQMRRYRAMEMAGLGRWFGAFLRNQLVADMGLFVEDNVGRCQSVATAPAYRRRGVCAAMVNEVCSFGFRCMDARQIIMMTAVDSAAARIYRAVGFRDSERVASLSISFARDRLPSTREVRPNQSKDID